MYLCNLKITGRDLPAALPETIQNEVSSMVDIISFTVPDTQPEQPLLQNKVEPPAPQQPRPQQPSNSQLLSQLTAQPTGFVTQPTGLQPSPIRFPGQSTRSTVLFSHFYQTVPLSGASSPSGTCLAQFLWRENKNQKPTFHNITGKSLLPIG